MEYENQEIGSRIRKARKEKGLSQEELGAMLNWTQSQISRIECGKDVDSLFKIHLLAEALDRPYLCFLEGDEVIEYLRLKDLQKEEKSSWRTLPNQKEEIYE